MTTTLTFDYQALLGELKNFDFLTIDPTIASELKIIVDAQLANLREHQPDDSELNPRTNLWLAADAFVKQYGTLTRNHGEAIKTVQNLVVRVALQLRTPAGRDKLYAAYMTGIVDHTYVALDGRGI